MKIGMKSLCISIFGGKVHYNELTLFCYANIDFV